MRINHVRFCQIISEYSFEFTKSKRILHVLLNLLNELGNEIKCDACRAFYRFFAKSLINYIIQEHKC